MVCFRYVLNMGLSAHRRKLLCSSGRPDEAAAQPPRPRPRAMPASAMVSAAAAAWRSQAKPRLTVTVAPSPARGCEAQSRWTRAGGRRARCPCRPAICDAVRLTLGSRFQVRLRVESGHSGVVKKKEIRTAPEYLRRGWLCSCEYVAIARCLLASRASRRRRRPPMNGHQAASCGDRLIR